MSRAYPPESRQRAVELARLREKPVSQIAADMGIAQSCLHRSYGRPTSPTVSVREGSLKSAPSWYGCAAPTVRSRWRSRSSSVLPRSSRVSSCRQNELPAGRSPATCVPSSSSTRWRWPAGAAARALARPSSIRTHATLHLLSHRSSSRLGRPDCKQPPSVLDLVVTLVDSGVWHGTPPRRTRSGCRASQVQAVCPPVAPALPGQ